MSLPRGQHLPPFRCRSHHQLTPPLAARLHYQWRPTAGPSATPARPGTSKDHRSMPQPSQTGVPALTAPSFYLTGRQPLRPGAILLATVAAVGALSSVFMPWVTPDIHISPPRAPALPVPPAPHPEPPRLTTKKMSHPRSTPSSSVIPPTLLCPPAGETMSAPFIPPSSFACHALETR